MFTTCYLTLQSRTNQAVQVPNPKRIREPMLVIMKAYAAIFHYLEEATVAPALVKLATPILKMAASKVHASSASFSHDVYSFLSGLSHILDLDIVLSSVHIITNDLKAPTRITNFATHACGLMCYLFLINNRSLHLLYVLPYISNDFTAELNLLVSSCKNALLL